MRGGSDRKQNKPSLWPQAWLQNRLPISVDGDCMGDEELGLRLNGQRKAPSHRRQVDVGVAPPCLLAQTGMSVMGTSIER